MTGTRVGVSELEAASVMGYAGEVLSAHLMIATGDAGNDAIGLRSPGGRIVRRGDGAAAAINFWGGLSARAALITEHDEAFPKALPPISSASSLGMRRRTSASPAAQSLTR